MPILIVLATAVYADNQIVVTDADIELNIKPVQEALVKYGLQFVNYPPVILTDRKSLATDFDDFDHDGLTKSEFEGIRDPGTGTFITSKTNAKLLSVKISIVNGLSADNFQRVYAHELCHAWIAQQGNRSLDRPFEEGSCEAVSYLAVATIGLQSARSILNNIEHNKNQLYGGGMLPCDSIFTITGWKTG